MTTVCAVVSEHETIIGSDTLCSKLGGNLKFDIGPKWIVDDVGGWAIGHSGDLAVLQMLRRNTVDIFPLLPKQHALTEKLAELFRAAGMDMKPATDAVLPNGDQNFIVAGPRVLYEISKEFSVIDHRRGGGIGFSSIGSGSLYALGAFHVLMSVEQPLADTCDAAVRAGMAFDCFSGGDCYVRRVAPDAESAEAAGFLGNPIPLRAWPGGAGAS